MIVPPKLAASLDSLLRADMISGKLNEPLESRDMTQKIMQTTGQSRSAKVMHLPKPAARRRKRFNPEDSDPQLICDL
jgi:hypothetical protein